MKKVLTTVLILISGILSAQVRIFDNPKDGYEKRITDFVNKIRIIDTHEHLDPEEIRIKSGNDIDFSILYTSYLVHDLISTGVDKKYVDMIYNRHLPVMYRWKILKRIFEASGVTAYGLVPLISARGLYGINEICDSTIMPLTLKIRERNKKGFYRYVLKDKAGIDLSILDRGHQRYDTTFYRHVERFTQYAMIYSRADIIEYSKQFNIEVKNLTDYKKVLSMAFEEGLKFGMVGVKTGLAYIRTLKFENIPEKRAEKLFSQVLNDSTLNSEDEKALQDYLVHRVLNLADKFDMPFLIHTGFLAGNGGSNITQTNPTLLNNLFIEYPDLKFILLHGGFPYGGEYGTLAKNYPNVYIDLCWDYVISPSYSERYLHEWLETVPNNKIMAFGGDYHFVEGAYAHSVMARQVISNVLISKVRSGYMSEEEAKKVAKMILRENAIHVFNLYGERGLFDDMDKVATLSGKGADWLSRHQSTKGFIRNWKVIGPFNYGDGLDDVLPPEKELEFRKTYSGMYGQVQWLTEHTAKTGYLDLISIFSKRQTDINPAINKGMAYCYTEITSPDVREATFTIGSNDGSKVWVNGKVVYDVHTGRSAVVDDDEFNVKLKKGVNKILVKIENYAGNWGLFLRKIDQDEELTPKIF